MINEMIEKEVKVLKFFIIVVIILLHFTCQLSNFQKEFHHLIIPLHHLGIYQVDSIYYQGQALRPL